MCLKKRRENVRLGKPIPVFRAKYLLKQSRQSNLYHGQMHGQI